nr:unnamed protein product [Callosobruchus analis]
MSREEEYVTYQGVTLMKKYVKYQERFDNMPVRDEDVWITGIPKSGTRWASELAWMIVHELDFEGGKRDLVERVPFTELFRLTDNEKDESEMHRDTISYVTKRYDQGPQCVKCHMPWILLPRQIREFEKRPRIIYVVRNPKGVITSSYHFEKLLHGYDFTLEEYADIFMEGKENYHPYWKHVFQFWEKRNEPNVFILRYEEMLKDPAGMIRKIVNFLGKKFTDEQLAILEDHVSFAKMKNNPAVNHEDGIRKVRQKKGLGEAKHNHMRAGKADSFKEEMSPELIKKIDKWTQENTKDSDFKGVTLMKKFVKYQERFHNMPVRDEDVWITGIPKSGVISSSYHYEKLLHGYDFTLEEYADIFMGGKENYHPYWKHILQFWEKRNEPNVFILRYEEMLKDPSGMIRKIVNFLGKEFTDDQLAILEDHVSFAKMKSNPAVNNEDGIRQFRKMKGLGEPKHNHMRAGRADSFKDEMSPELIEKIDKWTQDNTKYSDFIVFHL